MRKLPLIPLDKANHLVYGAALASAGSLHAWWLGLLLCALAAIGKEIHDRISHTGQPDLKDCLATLLGGALVVVPPAVKQLRESLLPL